MEHLFERVFFVPNLKVLGLILQSGPFCMEFPCSSLSSDSPITWTLEFIGGSGFPPWCVWWRTAETVQAAFQPLGPRPLFWRKCQLTENEPKAFYLFILDYFLH